MSTIRCPARPGRIICDDNTNCKTCGWKQEVEAERIQFIQTYGLCKVGVNENGETLFGKKFNPNSRQMIVPSFEEYEEFKASFTREEMERKLKGEKKEESEKKND